MGAMPPSIDDPEMRIDRIVTKSATDAEADMLTTGKVRVAATRRADPYALTNMIGFARWILRAFASPKWEHMTVFLRDDTDGKLVNVGDWRFADAFSKYRRQSSIEFRDSIDMLLFNTDTGEVFRAVVSCSRVSSFRICPPYKSL